MPGSVMIVAGLELTRETRKPSDRRTRQACVPKESNSAACPRTIGPDPITRTELMSSRLGTDTPLDHELGEPVEQVTGVVRTGRRLRVVLDGEGRHVKTPDALHDVVVEADVADLGAAVRRLGDAVARGV